MPKIDLLTKESLIEKAIETLTDKGAVDVVRLANELDIRVYEIDLPKGLSGAATLEENGKYSIYISDEDPPTRQRFSIAHELAHCVLHKEKIIENGEIHRDNVNKSPEELEANKLAEEIVMPGKLLAQYLGELNIDGGVIIDKKIISRIANKFNVSELVVIIRLRALGYNVPYIYYA